MGQEMELKSKRSQTTVNNYSHTKKNQPTLKCFIALSQNLNKAQNAPEPKRSPSNDGSSIESGVHEEENIKNVNSVDLEPEILPCRIRKRLKRCIPVDMEPCPTDTCGKNDQSATNELDGNSPIALERGDNQEDRDRASPDTGSTVCGYEEVSKSSEIETLSVLDLTLSKHEQVWPKLGLEECSDLLEAGEVMMKKKHPLLFKEQSVDVSPSENRSKKSERVDWRKWLWQLPVAMNSKYFRDYIDIVCTMDDALRHVPLESSKSDMKPASCSLPSWILPDKIKDGCGRRPEDPDYDVGTLWLPHEKKMRLESKHSTPAMLQYWNIKKDHFDKVIFFKFGKFYEIFYIDAFVINRFCNLRWIACDEKPHVGFPESSLHHYAEKVVTNGFKVVVVEQMETPKEMTERNRDASLEIKAKAVKREICDVFSIGTLLHESMLPKESRFLFSVYSNDSMNSFGFAYTDVSTSQIWVGDCTRDHDHSPNLLLRQFDGILSPVSQAFRTLFSQVLPIEVVFDPAFLPHGALTYLKQTPVSPHLNAIRAKPSQDMSFALEWIQKLQKRSQADTGCSVELANEKVFIYLEESKVALQAFAFLCRYLDSVLLLEKILPFARFQRVTLDFLLGENSERGVLNDSINRHGRQTASSQGDEVVHSVCHVEEFNKRLIMDSVALRHLHVIEGKDGGVSASLFHFLDQTITPMGKRLLKRWIISPLYDVSQINRRLDCTTWFLNHSMEGKCLRNKLKKIGDLERTLTRFCTRSLQKFRTAVYFDNIHSKYFREFIEMLNSFHAVVECLEVISKADESNEIPARLKELCCLSLQVNDSLNDSEESNEEESKQVFEDIRRCLLLNTATQEWVLAKNVDEAYDRAFSAVELIKKQLQEYLANLLQEAQTQHQVTHGSDIRYTHSKFPYEIEVPQNDLFVHFVQSKDETAKTVTSSRQGYIRFRTEAILEYVAQLEDSTTALKDVLYGCQQRLFQKFYSKYYDTCLAMISSLSELDIYIGFSMLASVGDPSRAPVSQHMCRPVLIPPCKGSPPVLRLINSRHPLVAEALPATKPYITNDIHLNDTQDKDGCQNFFLVTGPNMGGKSTLLRQTCLAVILAQLGAYVPATECALTPVDRIFTRLGAYDAIYEGRSAFLVELEESVPAALYSNECSLVILDEFGRGTSSSDGAALALALATQLATVNKTRCLFSTHFQLLADELEHIPNIRCVHMGFRSDPDTASIAFLYKLSLGPCTRSHGIHVAQMAGVLPEIIAAALQQCDQLHHDSLRLHVVLRLKNFACEVLDALEDANLPESWDTLLTRFSDICAPLWGELASEQ